MIMDSSSVPYIVFSCLLFTHTVSAITCSICGQSNLTAPGECTSQFQYDCLTNSRTQQLNQQQPADAGEQRQQKVLCRTTRTKLSENLFAMVKECVTENEHLNRYPDGKAFGCETVRSNSTYPTTYCVCDQDLCNSRSLDEQLQQPDPAGSNGQNEDIRRSPIPTVLQPPVQQPPQPPRQTPVNNQQSPNAPTRSQNQPSPLQTNSNQQSPNRLAQPVSPQPQSSSDEVLAPVEPAPWETKQVQSSGLIQEPLAADRPSQGASFNASNRQQPIQQSPSPQTSGENVPRRATTPQIFVPLNTEKVEFLTDSPPILPASNARGTSDPPNKPPGSTALVCMVCSESNVTSSQDCQSHTPQNCRTRFPTSTNLFCFSKAVTLPTGQSQVEKRCASEERLIQELGLSAIQPTCFSGQDGHARIDYCICETDKCNQLPISNQANMYPPLTANDLTGTSNGGQQRSNLGNTPSTQQSTMCYVCGESDQTHPSDCSQQYEYDCSRQYPQSSTVLCLTRLTKVASGRYNIEKRCITLAEHQQQYPGNEVTLNGCNEAWNGYVQYCVCQGTFCNGHNITTQQNAHQWQPKSNNAPIDPESENETVQPQQPQPASPLPPARPQPPQPPRLPNGLLVPPSTRLPLSPQPAQSNVSTVREDNLAGRPTSIRNNVQETASPPSPTTPAKVANPWDNRTGHRSQQNPTSSRRGGANTVDDEDTISDTASYALPGYLHLILALITYTLVMFR